MKRETTRTVTLVDPVVGPLVTTLLLRDTETPSKLRAFDALDAL